MILDYDAVLLVYYGASYVLVMRWRCMLWFALG